MKQIKRMAIFLIAVLNMTTYGNGVVAEKVVSQQAIDKSIHQKAIIVNEKEIEKINGVCYNIDNNKGEIKEAILCYKNKMYVPLKKIPLLLGAKIVYLNDQKKVIISKGKMSVEISLKIDEKITMNQSKSSYILLEDDDTNMTIIYYQGQVYVLARSIAEQLGYDIRYSSKKKTLVFDTNNDSLSVSEHHQRVEVPYNGEKDFSYVKHVTSEDILIGRVSIEIDGKKQEEEIKYVKNQLAFYVNDGVTFEQVRNMIKGYDGIIIGYVSAVDYYQIEFKESTLEELLELANKINEEQMIYDETAYISLALRN